MSVAFFFHLGDSCPFLFLCAKNRSLGNCKHIIFILQAYYIEASLVIDYCTSCYINTSKDLVWWSKDNLY